MTSSLKFRGASVSSSSAHQWTNDVFLSFRGQGTRKNFTGHLYDALERDGLKTYIDDERLRRGEEIPSELLKAIEESRISVIVLSENYASSAWCLEELTKIFECVEKKKHMVLPVFDGVDPSDVRNQRNNIKKSFGKLEERFRDNPEKVERWKAVLRQVGNISGWHLDGDSRHEALVIDELVRRIASEVGEHPNRIKSFGKKPDLYENDDECDVIADELIKRNDDECDVIADEFIKRNDDECDVIAYGLNKRFKDSFRVASLSLNYYECDVIADEFIKRNDDECDVIADELIKRNYDECDVDVKADEFIKRFKDSLRVARLSGGIQSLVRGPHLSSSPNPIGVESPVQLPQSSTDGIESPVQVPNLSSSPSGNGEQGDNPSILSQGLILIFIGLVIALLQLGNLFETHPVNMWIAVAASVMCFLSHAAMTKINGTHWTIYSQTIDIFRILSGILAAVSLLSTRLPHQCWWLLFAIWALLAFIIVAGTWIYSRAKRRGVEARIHLSRVGV